MEKRSFLDGGPLVTQCHLSWEKKKQRERESDVGIGPGSPCWRGTVFTFESNSQSTRIVISFANEGQSHVMKLYKSSNVRENGVYSETTR